MGNVGDYTQVKESLLAFYAKRSFADLGRQSRRRRVFQEQEGKCLGCDLDTWLGKLIVLELDHVDGNRTNNSRENLRGLCLNCHAQTDTYRFGGRKHTVESKKKTGVSIRISRRSSVW